jgi:hypothetical protein
MIYKSVKSVVWSSRSQERARAAEDRAKQSAEVAFHALSQAVSGEELNRMYREWERGERQIRVENGFIIMTFTPAVPVTD